jgi:hypothetical protein
MPNERGLRRHRLRPHRAHRGGQRLARDPAAPWRVPPRAVRARRRRRAARGLRDGLTDYEYQMLSRKRDAAGSARRARNTPVPEAARLADGRRQSAFLRATSAATTSRNWSTRLRRRANRRAADADHRAHDQGLGLECRADPRTTRPCPTTRRSPGAAREAGPHAGRTPFALFDGSDEEAASSRRGAAVPRRHRGEHEHAARANRAKVRERSRAGAGARDSLEIDLKLFPMAHTQWMWGQLAAKLVRIGTQTRRAPAGPQRCRGRRTSTQHEQRWDRRRTSC